LVLGIGIALGWWLVPGFWRVALNGIIGGVIAGLIILGPGLRAAMRLVAILDPVRTPEFTLDGTMFLIVLVGGGMGGIFGVAGAMLRTGFGLRLPTAGLIPALLVMAIIAFSSDLRAELLGLGAGPWVNIPLFGGVALAYGLATMRIVSGLERRRKQRKVVIGDVRVPA
jgi:hypothetical protein